jgi:choline kinase
MFLALYFQPKGNRTMQAVVLAAGTGSRLKHMTESIPKALVPVAGEPLLAYTLAFARLTGCEEIVVVVGAFGRKVIELLSRLELPEVSWVENPDYLKGNLYSLGAARGKINKDFLLLNTDHIYHRDIAAKVKSQCSDLTAFCDQDRDLGADDMKVSLNPDGRLGLISKQLSSFERGYVGMTYCPAGWLARYFEAFDRVAERVGDSAVVEMVLGDLAENGGNPAVGDISGVGWLEIDTPGEHASAEKAIGAARGSFAVVTPSGG